MSKICFYHPVDWNIPSGGHRQVYRLIDILNKNGFNAFVSHIHPDFRLKWFENKTKIVCVDDLILENDDIVIIPEVSQNLPDLFNINNCRIIVYAQNTPLKGFHCDLSAIKNVYEKMIDGVIVSSDYLYKVVKTFFPSIFLRQIAYSFDKPPFSYCGDKKKQICYMPRKMKEQQEMIRNLLLWSNIANDWNFVEIDGKTESEVADIFRESALFLSFSELEGFGMPVAEAMACGCVVVGYTGFAGREFMLPYHCYPIDDGDFQSFVCKIKEVTEKPMNELIEMGENASEFIRKKYSSEKEENGIVSVFKELTMPKIELSDKMETLLVESKKINKKDIAAVIHVYDEGPYLAYILRWLQARVGKIFVFESSKTWTGVEIEYRGLTEKTVKEVINNGLDNIEYIKIHRPKDDTPMKNEAMERNIGMDIVRSCGFIWAWIIDADEFYTDSDADTLWHLVGENVKNGIFAYACNNLTYWRSLYCIVEPNEIPAIVIVRTDIKFNIGRSIIVKYKRIRNCLLRHYSYAKTPFDIRRKLISWGHANEVNENWFENVFLSWNPKIKEILPPVGDKMQNLLQDEHILPEALSGHPYNGLEIIEDVPQKKRIKVVILHYNFPSNADLLYEQLSTVFDEVELLDSGSDADKIPKHLTLSFPNIYWTGAWNEAFSRWSDWDVIWVIGCDIVLNSEPILYRQAIESSLPFGCWSPVIDGRAHDFMLSKYYNGGKVCSVTNIEGMALAVSGELARKVGKLVEGSPIGFGQDFWLCYRSRQENLKNIIDGRVVVYHPSGIGYNEEEALNQMQTAFSAAYGDDFRQTIFEYSTTFTGNLREVLQGEVVMAEKQLTIMTVENGWGIEDFESITSKFPNVRRIVVRKGTTSLRGLTTAEVVDYEDLSRVMGEADIALFTKVGAANTEDYRKILESGIPTIVQVQYHQNLIKHEENGWIYGIEQWGIHWVSVLIGNVDLRNKVREWWKKVPKEVPADEVTVSVITPTWRRDPMIVSRCMDCLTLQTRNDWEQLICSDGEEEVEIRDLVRNRQDIRFQYFHIDGHRDGDFGNTVRSEMLKKVRGKYVMFFDDDNIILPSYMMKMITALENNVHAVLSVCQIMHFGPLNEAIIGKPPQILNGLPIKLFHVDSLQVLVRKEIAQECGWDVEHGYISDGYAIEKFKQKGDFIEVPEVLGIHI